LNGRAEFVGQDGGEGGLAQAGRAVEEDVRHRLLEFAAGFEDDAKPLDDRFLPDHFPKPARPQRRIALFFLAAVALNDRFARHVSHSRSLSWSGSMV
jgi:hypothetical protein